MAAEAAATGVVRGRVGERRERLADETKRLYALDWARFSAHCVAVGARSAPASAATVIAFIETPGVGRAARGRRLAAIDQRHRALGLSPPGEITVVRAALRRARRDLPRRTRKPTPSGASLQQAAQRCPGDLAGRRDRALLLLLAGGIGRRAIVALQAEQVRFTERGLEAPSASVARGAPSVCPVRAVEEWLRLSQTRYGPVFRKVNRWGALERQALGADACRLILARRLGDGA